MHARAHRARARDLARFNEFSIPQASSAQFPSSAPTAVHATMEYRMFGKSGLKVSALGYGCMTFGDPSNGNVRPRTS